MLLKKCSSKGVERVVVVKVYYAPYCPHCENLLRILTEHVEHIPMTGVAQDPKWFYDGDSGAKIPSGITVIPVQVSSDFEPTIRDLPSAKYVSSKWLKKFASTDLQKELAKKGELVDLIGRGGYPVVEIEYLEGDKLKRVIVTGGISDDVEKYANHLKTLILSFHEIEKTSLRSEMKLPYVYEI